MRFKWDLANNNGDLIRFHENIPSTYQPRQLEIPHKPKFYEKRHPEIGDCPWPYSITEVNTPTNVG